MSNTAQLSTPTSYHKSPNRRQRDAVLVVLHADGWCEVFAEHHVDICMRVMPYMQTAQGQIEAERFLEANLPHRFKSLYWPGNRRAADMVRTVQPLDIARRDLNLAILKAMTEAGQMLRGETDREGRRIWIA